MDCVIGCHDIEFEYTVSYDGSLGWMHTVEFPESYHGVILTESVHFTMHITT